MKINEIYEAITDEKAMDENWEAFKKECKIKEDYRAKVFFQAGIIKGINEMLYKMRKELQE